MDARWAPFQTLVACWQKIHPPARAVPLVAPAEAQGQLEPPVAERCAALPSWSEPPKPVTVLAETSIGSEVPAFAKRLEGPGEPEVESTRR